MAWNPTREDDIRTLLETVDFDESHHLDVKASIGSSPRARKDTAKDLAAFAIDGGTLVIGVGEDKAKKFGEPGRFFLAPDDAGDEAVLRVEQIAQLAVVPPVIVRIRRIDSHQSGKGYLFVEIPPSPQAPHMVDGKYYGRADRSNRVLHDAEVQRLIAARAAREGALLVELEAMQRDDPFPKAAEGGRPLGHLYLIARPRTAEPGLADELIHGDDDAAVRSLVRRVGQRIPRDLRSAMPAPTVASKEQRRARGVAFTTLGRGRTATDSDRQAVDIEVQTDGTIAALVGGTSAPAGGTQHNRVVSDRTIVSWVWHLALWARAVSDSTGYQGEWEFGLRSTGMRRATSKRLSGPEFDELDEYDQDVFARTARAFTSDLEQDPAQVVQDLLKPLLRALGSWQHFRGDGVFDTQPG
ncbi:AlbA family DNA-binding domain-containing protein [Curtobacterium flaccumfaciens]|uniref:AlbA family DNA-binding domain-containing protein n=1 Tax=Curtobacterium flaccumfaciens TaxID=2035 RepID=UPI003D9A9411